MHFKKLDLLGFKSFANETSILFEQGVTAIVGPNGCGKSNVADAIRWVLGEQSAKSLRGECMEDVIFNGSSMKEPLNYAEVSLTLSNESRILPIEYDEVTLTRRLYRSGESEYLINKNIVRLKDLHELLLGTGIGTESYSIIEQGKMDIILNSRPEDRRTIFEEAAGITKFKSKKREALRRLEQTEQNLLRVNDIILEVKRQIGSTERQARKAEAYRVEFEKLKTLELAVASKEFITFEDRRQTKQRDLAELRRKEAACRAEADEAERRVAGKRSELDAHDQTLNERRAEQLAAEAAGQRDTDRLHLDRERIGELGARDTELASQLEAASKRLEELEAEQSALRAEWAKIQSKEEQGRRFLDTVESEFAAIERTIEEAHAAAKAAKAVLLDLAHTRAQEQSELAKVHAHLASVGMRRHKTQVKRAGVVEESARTGAELEQARGAVGACEGELTAQEALHAAKERERSDVAAGIRSEEEALDSLSLLQSTVKSKLELLQELKDKREGFLGGVKALLEQKEKGTAEPGGMVGVLADLVKVERGYELAVEAALESYLQAVIFDNADNVLKAADFLRPLKRGRALLVGLDLGAAPQVRRPAGAGEPVLNRLTAHPSVKELLESIIGNVFIVKDPKEAFRICQADPSIVCVTKDGERFEGRVVMGGSLSREAELTLVGRQARIDNFHKEHEGLVAAIEEKGRRLAEARAEEAALASQADSITAEISRLQIAVADRKSALRHLEDKKKKIDEEIELFDLELEDLALEENTLTARETEHTDSLSRLAGDEAEGTAKLIQAEQTAQGKAAEKESLIARLAETRLRQESLTAERAKIERLTQRHEESKQGEASRRISLENEKAQGLAKRAGLEAECAALAGALARGEARRNEIIHEMERVRVAREGIVSELAGMETERREKAEFLKTAQGHAHAYELEGTQLQHEIERLKERIFNAYQVDLAAGTEAFGVAPDDIEAAKAQIQSQRDRLMRMGPVNLVAIQEYEEMKERYDFLTRQHADLTQAKEDLHKAIVKINRTTRELFSTTFEKIQKNFSEYYRLLFGGGAAQLVLLDESDVLECGIEIVARPPGKKLRSISLLSGGEKALTAIALLFAIFKVKPSPFCILDEIDAPLDESNVDRFLNVLKEFLSTSQFILVTHNKRTMNLADAMYGVTMAQTGISRIVSVRFSEKPGAVMNSRLEESQV